MPSYFENPNQTTFKALKFNGQIFLTGRPLFIHFMKYFPSIIEQQTIESKSTIPFTLENFSEATRAQKEWFKGLRLEYVDIDKSLKEEIKKYSYYGEGWWPERKNLLTPGIDYELNFVNFAMNYEDDEYFRCLGKGVNIPNEERPKYQTGVDFTRNGYIKMLKTYQRLILRKVMFNIPMPYTQYGYYHLEQMSLQSPMPVLKPADWTVWRIKNKADREKYMKREVVKIEVPSIWN